MDAIWRLLGHGLPAVHAAPIVRLDNVVECGLVANLEYMPHMQLAIDLFSQNAGSRILALIASTSCKLL
jgi:hypothetical protein